MYIAYSTLSFEILYVNKVANDVQFSKNKHKTMVVIKSSLPILKLHLIEARPVRSIDSGYFEAAHTHQCHTKVN